ncbi:EamA family transporter, partial [Candidatus Bathyarchaeota archaeon]|nr:EamA family transporter [Candidatus Bathyarchaeota archaeon]
MAIEHDAAGKSDGFSLVDALLVGMSFIWGLNFTVIKAALDSFLPLSFNALRFSLASLLLIIFLKLKENSLKIRREDLKQFMFLALIGNTIYQILFINGIYRTTAGNSSLILATTPIFVAIFSSILGVEKIKRRMWQSILLSFTGIVLIVLGSGKPISLAAQNLIGDLLILACTLCWSAYTVLSKPLLSRYSPLKLVGLTVAMGTPLLVIVSAPSLLDQKWSTVTLEAWLSLAYSACLAVALGYAIWYTGVSRIGSAKTALYEYIITVVAVAASWILLNETMSPIQLFGVALVFAGLYLSRKQ